MNRKYINYLVFLGIVAVVVGLAVNHSRHMAGLVSDMEGNDKAKRIAAAQELVTGEQFMDSITGETVANRVRIVQALEDWGTKQATTQLVAYLKDMDRPVRDRITLALASLATRSPDHLQEVVNGIKDGDANVRKGCIAALQSIGQATPAKAQAVLARALPDVPAPEIARALANVDPKVADQLISKVAALMKADAGARESGGDVLSALVDKREESVAALLPELTDKDEGVRMGAASGLGKVGSKTAVAPLIRAMKTDTAQVRRVAIGAIALIADPSGEAALTEALANPDDDNDARAQAAVGLGRIGTPTAIATLIKALSDDDLKVQVAAVGALGRAGEPAVAPLLALLKDPRPALRVRAAESLQATGSRAACGGLVAALSDPEPAVRRAACVALGAVGGAAQVPALIARLADRDGAVATAAADALSRMGAVARPALVAAMAGPEDVAFLAARALGREGQDAVPAVAAEVARKPSVGRWAVVALGDAGGPEAVKTLQSLEQAPDPLVKRGASEALQKLGID